MKTIDVQPGDTWTAHQSEFRLLQHRDGKNREINSLGYTRWHDHCTSWEPIPSWMAMDAIGRLGYTLTPAAKPDAKPAITHRHGPIENVMVTAAEAKSADVPVVDAVWVEGSFGDGKTFLTPHPTMSCANRVAANIRRANNGTARIVRIRSVDEQARFLAHHANERLDQHVNRLAEAHARITALESRLAAEKPADKDAARVVKAPTFAASRRFSVPEQIVVDELNKKWRTALASQGIKVEDAE